MTPAAPHSGLPVRALHSRGDDCGSIFGSGSGMDAYLDSVLCSESQTETLVQPLDSLDQSAVVCPFTKPITEPFMSAFLPSMISLPFQSTPNMLHRTCAHVQQSPVDLGQLCQSPSSLSPSLSTDQRNQSTGCPVNLMGCSTRQSDDSTEPVSSTATVHSKQPCLLSTSGVSPSLSQTPNQLILPVINRVNGIAPILSSTRTTQVSIPLQLLNPLPNLRPGTSILLNVKVSSSNASLASCPHAATVHNSTNTSLSASDRVKSVATGGTELPPHRPKSACLLGPADVKAQGPTRFAATCGMSASCFGSPPSSSIDAKRPLTVLNGSIGQPSFQRPPTTSFPLVTHFLMLRQNQKGISMDASPLPTTTTCNSVALMLTSPTPKVPCEPTKFVFIPNVVPTAVNTVPHSLVSLIPSSTGPSFPVQHSLLNNQSWLQLCHRPPVSNNDVNVVSSLVCTAVTTSVESTLSVSNLLANDVLPNAEVSPIPGLPLPVPLIPTINPQTIFLTSPVASNSGSPSNLVSSPSHHPATSFLSSSTNLSSSMSTSSCTSLDPSSLPSPLPAPNPVELASICLPQTLVTPLSMVTPIDTNIAGGTPEVKPQKNAIVLPSADNLLSPLRAIMARSFSSSTPMVGDFSSSRYRRFNPSSHSPPSSVSTTSVAPAVASSSSVPVQTRLFNTSSVRRRHQCPYCPKSCERKDNLQAHIRTHTGERPYPCRFCPKAFPQKDHLRAHIRTHTGEKPYRCPQCHKAFAQLGNLHRHVKTHRR